MGMGNGLPVGSRLAEFEITTLLGEGGFGIVYLAIDHSLGRRVALKEYMPASLASRGQGSQVQVRSARHRDTFELGLRSFVNEARLLAQFDHPALVKVYRFWEANGTAYMVMPYYEGTTLRDLLLTLPGRPDEAWLRALLAPLTEALQVIHAEQCYHRDIAPDNVMMLAGAHDRPLLLDFGAARRVIGDMTQALTVILKPGYAPVEQYAEIPGLKQGPWTDVYALAAVVYFAITGRTPPPSVGRLLNDTYEPLARVAGNAFSERFAHAIDRALAVRPEERTQSVEALRADLGLGQAQFDAYSTKPMPPGSETLDTTAPAAASAPAPVPPTPTRR
ncbi:MAG: serine/threonine-protein kinase, partial [Rubrivivax sp.]